MKNLGSERFEGVSGKRYDFDVFAWPAQFKPFSAVYVMARQFRKVEAEYGYAFKYVGESDDVATAMAGHEKSNCFLNERVNVVCVHREDDEDTRHAIEADLILKFAPPCNR